MAIVGMLGPYDVLYAELVRSVTLPRPFRGSRGVLSCTGLGGPVLPEPVAAGNMYRLEDAVQQKRPRQFILCPSL